MPIPGGSELIVVLVIILLLFGAKRIPELAKGLGSGVREFKKGTRDEPEVEKTDEEKKEEELSAAESKNGEKQDSRLKEDASVEADKAEQKQH